MFGLPLFKQVHAEAGWQACVQEQPAPAASHQRRRDALLAPAPRKAKRSAAQHSPALMWMPQCVLRAMALPTVLVMPTHSAPEALAYSSARKVSAVSPDCGWGG